MLGTEDGKITAQETVGMCLKYFLIQKMRLAIKKRQVSTVPSGMDMCPLSAL